MLMLEEEKKHFGLFLVVDWYRLVFMNNRGLSAANGRDYFS